MIELTPSYHLPFLHKSALPLLIYLLPHSSVGPEGRNDEWSGKSCRAEAVFECVVLRYLPKKNSIWLFKVWHSCKLTSLHCIWSQICLCSVSCSASLMMRWDWAVTKRQSQSFVKYIKTSLNSSKKSPLALTSVGKTQTFLPKHKV